MHVFTGLLSSQIFVALVFSVSAETTASTLRKVPSASSNSRHYGLVARVDNQEGSVAIRKRGGLYYVPVYFGDQRLDLEIDTGSSGM